MTAKSHTRHVMVINDVPALLDVICEILEAEGYRTSRDDFASADLKQIMEAIAADTPDVIVLDLMVGEEALGWQLVQMLKLDRTTDSIPTIICTAAVQRVKELQAHLDAKGIGIVIKPFNIDDLLKAVGDAIGDSKRNSGSET